MHVREEGSQGGLSVVGGGSAVDNILVVDRCALGG